MNVYYSDHITFPLPAGHRFPAAKYALLRQELLQQNILQERELIPATHIAPEIVTLAHTQAYFNSILDGSIDDRSMRQIGIPWSPELVRRSLSSVGGSLQAAQDALRQGIAGNLGGGTHHAMADQGRGFCVFNDLAIVSLYWLQNQIVRKIAIIDLDVHQGDGNAALLGKNPHVFTFSMHGAKNYPFHRVPSTLDIDLPDGTQDQEYLAALENALPRVLAFRPEIIFYLAGVDPLAEDRLGRLQLSMQGLAQRDYLVLNACRSNQIPVAIVMGGGYAQPIEHTARAHAQTYRVAKEIYPI
ncbi:MAG: histone deacetylase [Chloroflexi bacterium]|nr:histone deacetylase [Chloroflexota bacterium]